MIRSIPNSLKLPQTLSNHFKPPQTPLNHLKPLKPPQTPLNHHLPHPLPPHEEPKHHEPPQITAELSTPQTLRHNLRSQPVIKRLCNYNAKHSTGTAIAAISTAEWWEHHASPGPANQLGKFSTLSPPERLEEQCSS